MFKQFATKGLALLLAGAIMAGVLVTLAFLSDVLIPKKQEARASSRPIPMAEKPKPKLRPRPLKRHRRALGGQRSLTLPSLNIPSSIQAPELLQPDLAPRGLLIRSTLAGEGPLKAASELILTEEMADEPPRVLARVPPHYPAAARHQELEGEVRVKLLIDRQGVVRRAFVVQSKPAGVFDEAALQAVRQWQFKPGVYKGKAVQVWALQQISFKLY